jgi:hypothetical protein
MEKPVEYRPVRRWDCVQDVVLALRIYKRSRRFVGEASFFTGCNSHFKAGEAESKISASSPRFLATMTPNFPERTHSGLATCAILTNDAASRAIRSARWNRSETSGRSNPDNRVESIRSFSIFCLRHTITARLISHFFERNLSDGTKHRIVLFQFEMLQLPHYVDNESHSKP